MKTNKKSDEFRVWISRDDVEEGEDESVFVWEKKPSLDQFGYFVGDSVLCNSEMHTTKFFGLRRGECAEFTIKRVTKNGRAR